MKTTTFAVNAALFLFTPVTHSDIYLKKIEPLQRYRIIIKSIHFVTSDTKTSENNLSPEESLIFGIKIKSLNFRNEIYSDGDIFMYRLCLDIQKLVKMS